MSGKSPRFDVATVPLRGKNLVEASAGTGKTHAITSLIVRLVVEEGLQPSEIAVITFTEAATAELKDRVRAQLANAEQVFNLAAQGAPIPPNDFAALLKRRNKTLLRDAQQLREAVENIDQAAISTIHGFCQRMLHDSALATHTAFDVELVPDLNDLRDDVIYDFWHRRIAPSSQLVSLAASTGIDLARLRVLFDHLRRNPNLRIQPSPGFTDADLALAVTTALKTVRTHGRNTDLNFETILRNNRTLGKLGLEADERPVLFAAVEQIVAGASDQIPANAACLFPKVASVAFKCAEGALPPFFAAWQKYVELHAQRAVALQHEFLNNAQQEFARRKAQQGVLGFEDLIQRLAAAVTAPGGAALASAMRAKFKAVLIDEFQDTDPTQLQIFDAVFGNGDHLLFYIGDPKQAIYAFRGGDVYTYLAGRKGAKPHMMGVNWRSDPGVVNAINQLFSRELPFVIEEIQYDAIAPRPGATPQFHHPNKARSTAFELLFVRRKDQKHPLNKGPARSAVARVVATDIVDLLQSGARIGERPVREGDIAVLTRNNKQCRLVQAELVAQGIHCVLAGDQNVFGSEDATELQFVLSAVLDPSSSRELKRALASRMIGQSGSNLAQLEEDPHAWNEWQAKFRHWGQLWGKYGFMRMFRELMSTAQSAETLLATRGGERALTNLLHLGELLHRASKGQHLGPAALTQWLREERNRAGKGKAAQSEYAEIRLESDESAVHILTVHKAKGLEYPIVYCPYLWDKLGNWRGKLEPLLYHDNQGAVLDIGLDDDARPIARSQNELESDAEERRVVYVGLTRAKHRCVIVWGGLKGWDDNAAAPFLHTQLTGNQNCSDDQLLADLETLAQRCGGDFNIHAVDWDVNRSVPNPQGDTARSLNCREIVTSVKNWARTDSFSGLVKPRATEDPTERAPAADEALIASEVNSAPEDDSVNPFPGSVSRNPRPRMVSGEPIVLQAFPRGSKPGDFFHKVFELIDFSIDPTQLQQVVHEQIAAFSISRSEDTERNEALKSMASRAILATLNTPLLADAPLRLVDVPLDQRFSEFGFQLPVLSLLDAHRLASVFSAQYASAELPADYSSAVAALPFKELLGYLHGVIDLIFQHEGKWYLVDYKSNYLGDFVEDYDQPQMSDKMAEAHYFLQYHLYTLGLHRYLQVWQPGYNYAEHFGGVLYLFIKGMQPQGNQPKSRTGIFFEKPPQARIEALDAVFSGAAFDTGGQQ